MPNDAILLLRPGQWWVGWWIDDPADRRVVIDICVPPIEQGDGWSYLDLELDVVRHQDGTVEVEDRDEFQTACADGWITPEEAVMALDTSTHMERVLATADEPFGEVGWRRLRETTV
jgi:predicted RNA-binding protein associated with RNAse of E/G family